MVFLQYLLPHQLINKLAKLLANSNLTWLKNCLIKLFLSKYPIDMQEAVNSDPYSYQTFNDFFTRKLQPNLRIIDSNPTTIVSPADGCIAQYGNIKQQLLINTKGTNLSLSNLIASQYTNLDPQIFANGKFMTIYLAPHNYHRVHMPITATLEQMAYIPGKLFSVNQTTVKKIPNVFTVNERAVTVFNTEFGKMAIILVGAMIVGNIVINWHQQPFTKQIVTWDYSKQLPINLTKGEEMGAFQLGSTVILLFSNNNLTFNNTIALNAPIKFGEAIILA
jgi:phosphatidylserine decarboxylase